MRALRSYSGRLKVWDVGTDGALEKIMDVHLKSVKGSDNRYPFVYPFCLNARGTLAGCPTTDGRVQLLDVAEATPFGQQKRLLG